MSSTVTPLLLVSPARARLSSQLPMHVHYTELSLHASCLDLWGQNYCRVTAEDAVAIVCASCRACRPTSSTRTRHSLDRTSMLYILTDMPPCFARMTRDSCMHAAYVPACCLSAQPRAHILRTFDIKCRHLPHSPVPLSKLAPRIAAECVRTCLGSTFHLSTVMFVGDLLRQLPAAVDHPAADRGLQDTHGATQP